MIVVGTCIAMLVGSWVGYGVWWILPETLPSFLRLVTGSMAGCLSWGLIITAMLHLLEERDD